jgi:hypothetical protein
VSHPVKGIDHCFALVEDLDKAASQFAALGFTLSPRGLHSAAKGTANYTIMFPDDYFELLGIVTPTEANAPRRDVLKRKGEGLHAIACRIEDAEGAARDLAELGISTEGLGHFDRPVPLSGRGSGVAAFSTVAFTAEEVPQGIVFMCQHRTPETVWLPELLDHPNTACGLGAVLAMSNDPQITAERFARLWAAGRVEPDGAGIVVQTGRNSAPLVVMSPQQMAAAYPGIDLSRTAQAAFTALRVKVTDLNKAAACLESSGIAYANTGEGVAVGPDRTSGMIVEFTAS